MAVVILFSASTIRAISQAPSGLLSQREAASVDKEVGSLAQEAERDFTNRDYVSAAKKYERLVALEPGSVGALNNLGISYHMMGEFRQAVQVLQRALRLDPELVTANLILGIDYVQLNEADQAIPHLERVLQRDRTNRDALLALASSYFALKRFAEAVRVYQREVKVRPQDGDAWYGLGLCFENLAERTTREIARIGKGSPYTQRLIGEFLTEQDAGFDAEDAFRRALAAGGAQEGLHAALGFACLRLGDMTQAGQEFKAEAQIHPGSLDGKLGMAALAMERGDFGTAERTICEIYKTDKGYFGIHLNFFLASLHPQTESSAVSSLNPDNSPTGCAPAGDLLKEELTSPGSSVQLEEAFQTAPAAKASAPQAGPSTVAAARAANEAGRYSECFEAMQGISSAKSDDILLGARCACLSGRFFAASEAAQSVLDREPQNLAAYYWQAEATRRLAQAAFQRAVSLSPNSWQGHLLLGDIYRQRKQWELAISHYQEAARLKPASPGPFMGLGAVYWQTGRNPQAETALRKALEIEPNNALADFVLGDVYVREHRFEEAVPLLKGSLARNLDLLAEHADLGKAFAALGQNEKAIAELQRALPMDRFGDIHYQLYVLYKKQGQAQLAQEALAESEKLRVLESERHRERAERAREIQKDEQEKH